MKVPIQNLSQEQLSLLPTEEDITFYEEHGWYISPKLIPDEIIDDAVRGSEQFYQGERDATLPVSCGYSHWQPEDGYNVVRNNEFVSLQKQELRQLALQPMIGAIAARLARTKSIRLLDDQLVYKPPQDSKSAVGWHSDRAYWATCSSDQLLTAWIPFHDCEESRSPLVVIDGSHRWSELSDLRFFNQQNLADLEQQFQQKGRSVIKVPMTLKKGQLSFHNCWTIHGSYPNQSSSPRLALAVHLQDETNHYQPYWNEKGEEVHIINEQFCSKLPNGYPDFSDPNAFPILWSESGR
jgi:ectoine hydroxylase-related dioxygenase (phytanoyl-CoA dioxygenase family)